MSLSPSLSASLVDSITRIADKRITGQEDSEEDESEDEAEHSDDGDSDDFDGSDEDGSDEVEDSDENDHVSVGVFNPRHSRGETTLRLRTETRSDGTGTNIMLVSNRR